MLPSYGATKVICFLGNAHFIIRRIMFLKNECMEKNTSAQWEFSGKIAFKDTLKASTNLDTSNKNV